MDNNQQQQNGREVVGTTWYDIGDAAVVAERYSSGGVLFFRISAYGERVPYSNIKSLDEEGVVVTEEEAMRRLAEAKKRFDSYSAGQP